MTINEDNRQNFQDLLSQVLANKPGVVKTPNYSDSSMRESIGSALSMPKISSSKGTTKNPSVPSDIRSALNANKDYLPGGKKNDPGFFGTIADDINHPMKGVHALGRGFMNAVDIISRPGYAARSALLETVKSINAGEPFWSLGDDIGYGLKEGITGNRKTGFGDVVHEGEKWDPKTHKGGAWNSLAAILDFPIGYSLVSNKIKESHPDAAKWFDRTIGLTGDIFTDPTTYIAPGVTTVGRGTIEAAKEGGRGALKRLIEGGAKAAEATGNESLRLTGKEAALAAVRKHVGDIAKEADLTSVDRVVSKAGKVVDKPLMGASGRFAADGEKASDRLVRHTVEAAVAKTEPLIYDIVGGAQKGKTIGNLRHIAPTVAEASAQSLKTELLTSTSKTSERFIKDAGEVDKAWTLPKIEAAKSSDPVFAVWHDTFIDELTKGTPVKLSMDKATQAAASHVDNMAADVASKITLELQKATLSIPTLRMMGKDVAYFPKIGSALLKGTTALKDSKFGYLNKAFSYGANFPGYSSLIAQKARSLGNARYKVLRDQVVKLSEGTSKVDRIAIHKALENGSIDLLPDILKEKAQGLKSIYLDIMNQEVGVGLGKRLNSGRVEDYAYTHLRSNNTSAVDKFLAAKNEAIKVNGTLAGYTSDAAKKLGLRPQEDAFTNVLMRAAKSNRMLTSHYFTEDLAAHYGIKATRLTNLEAKARGLSMIDGKLSPDMARAMKLKPGEHLYLDKNIHDILEKYHELTKPAGNSELQSILKNVDNVTRIFKKANTIYFPGFHIRNFVSDAYMGAMDGVRGKDYSAVLKNWTKRATADLNVGGETMKFSKVLKAYEEHAASGGFLSTEVGGAKHLVGGNLKKDGTAAFGKDVVEHLVHPTSIPSAIQRASEHREDFGRFAHFYHALNEEYPAALKRLSNKEEAWQSAINSATYRVNKYKFDYGALTRIEQQGMRRGIPFYTYMRKAIPTLLESMYLSPKYLVQTNHAFNSLTGSQNFDGPQLPKYLKDLGFMSLINSDEPWGITSQMLPQDTFSNAFQNPVANLNPILKTLIDFQAGKDSFTGKPVGNLSDIVTNNWRGTSLLKKLGAPTDQVLSTPGLKGHDSVSIQEKLASILGVPLLHDTKFKQQKALAADKSQLNKVISNFNKDAAKTGKKILFGKGNTIRVKNYITGKTINYPDLESALSDLNLG